jgi:hypothetical protein
MIPQRVGCPIRTPRDQSLLAAPPGFSQRATSFIASWRQGIHQMPFSRSKHSKTAMHRNNQHDRNRTGLPIPHDHGTPKRTHILSRATDRDHAPDPRPRDKPRNTPGTPHPAALQNPIHTSKEPSTPAAPDPHRTNPAPDPRSRRHRPHPQCTATNPHKETPKEPPRGDPPPTGAHGDGRVRTDDPLLAKQVLSQLSYAPQASDPMGQGGFEPPTPRLSSVCSNQLSY